MGFEFQNKKVEEVRKSLGFRLIGDLLIQEMMPTTSVRFSAIAGLFDDGSFLVLRKQN